MLMLLVRLLAAAPLLLIGVQHLTGTAPMLPILEGAGFPNPDLGATVAPIVEVAAGVMLVLGLFTRLGALAAMGTMAGAVYAHLNHDWADEPPLALPVAVLLLAAMVLVKGPGSTSIDGRKGG